MSRANNFSSWARKCSYGRGLICHFYLPEADKKYYGNLDFAYMNLASSARGWVVKGTPGHGVTSIRGKTSPVPCLNCFEVDDTFFTAFRDLERDGNQKFWFGLLLNKRKLKNHFGKDKVIDVSTKYPSPYPPPNLCHHYDNPRFRSGVLQPFNYCGVVRIEIPQHRILKMPIAEIPKSIITGLLVKRELKGITKKLLKQKSMWDVEVLELP